MKQKVTLVVPCYNEEEVLPLFYKEYVKVAKRLPEYIVEALFVDDGSKDRTIEIVKELAESDERVKYVSFSRNFERGRDLCRSSKCGRRLCGDHGCGSARSSGIASGDAGCGRKRRV